MAVSLNGDGTITGLSTLDSVTITGLTSLTTTDLTADTTTLVVDSANNLVGVGTNSPNDITGTGLRQLVVGNNSGNNGVIVNCSSSGDSAYSFAVNNVKLARVGYDYLNNMTFQTNNAEKMRITSSGNVGIGTSSPTYRLQVQDGLYTLLAGADSSASTLTDATQKVMRFGVPHYTNAEEPVNVIFASITSGENGVLIGGGTGVFNAATRISFYTAANTTTTNGSERMRITSTGNVGIGTSSPLGRLSVLGEGRIVTIGDSGTANTPAITARNTADTSYAFLNISTYRTKFFTEGSERMVINESGNVGIGTSSPSEKLDVSGTVKATSFSGSASGLTGIPAPSELSTASGSAPSYSARAWVNFNGTGTVAIRASGNVSSITDSGVGKYTVNFTTAMSDTNYTVAGMAGDSIRAGNVLSLGCNTYSVSQSTSATTIAGLNDAGTLQDKTYANVVVFR